jgi:hypothetical protein
MSVDVNEFLGEVRARLCARRFESFVASEFVRQGAASRLFEPEVLGLVGSFSGLSELETYMYEDIKKRVTDPRALDVESLVADWDKRAWTRLSGDLEYPEEYSRLLDVYFDALEEIYGHHVGNMLSNVMEHWELQYGARPLHAVVISGDWVRCEVMLRRFEPVRAKLRRRTRKNSEGLFTGSSALEIALRLHAWCPEGKRRLEMVKVLKRFR